MTLQDVLGLLIHKARIPIDELVGPMPEATPEQVARLERLRFRTDRASSSESIDDAIYGRGRE